VEIGLPEALIAQPMSNDHSKRDTMSLEEATVSNMWKFAATVEVLEQLGQIIEMGQRVAKGTTH